MLTLWTVSHPSTPALCSAELESSAHPLGHSLLFVLLKGEVSEREEQKGFHYIELKIHKYVSPSIVDYSVVKYLLLLLPVLMPAEVL